MSYQRRTLVRKEQWPRIGNWYWCPLPIIDDRVEAEHRRLNVGAMNSPLWFAYASWERLQYKLECRLAHACDDGRIRSPSWVEYYKGKTGGVGVYGKCRVCDKKLSDGIKGIIIMEKEL